MSLGLSLLWKSVGGVHLVYYRNRLNLPLEITDALPPRKTQSIKKDRAINIFIFFNTMIVFEAE